MRNSSVLLGPVPSPGVTFITLLMTPSGRMKWREYGRQQNNMLTNSINSIPIDILPPLRQYLRLSLNGAIKMGTQDQIPDII
jgi:hypothetical protein